MVRLFPLAFFAIPTLTATIARRDSISLFVPSSCPTSASHSVDSRFPAYGFELASFVGFALDANGQPNTFSQNLMNSISARTGGYPIIRVGGTSADYARLVLNQTEPALPVAQQNNYQDVGNTTIGPSFWNLFKSLTNSTYVLQIPMGIDNTSLAAAYAASAINAFGLNKIEALELGNEPDLYPVASGFGSMLWPPTYQGSPTNESYVYTFGAFASAVSTALNLRAHTPIFQAFDTSHRFGDSEGYELDVPTVFAAGININKTIKAVSHHYYQTFDTNGPLTNLMDHGSIAYELDFLKPHIAYCRSTTTGTHSYPIPFVMGEVGNSMNSANNYTYQAVLGSALWQVDFQLYALSIGVTRVHWQQIMHAGYNMWLPVDSGGVAAQVFSNYYAQPFIADFISNSGVTRVWQLNTTTAPEYIVAYAAYERTLAQRIAVVNFNLWDSRSGVARGAAQLSLQLPPKVKSVQVRTLGSADGAYADASSITYGSSQWTAASNGLEVTGVDPAGVATYAVSNKTLTISVQDSSALLIILHR